MSTIYEEVAMSRWSRSVLLATVVVTLTGLPAFAADSARLSGRVVEIRDGGRTLVVEEQGPWTGPNTGLVRHVLKLDPNTATFAVHQTGEWVSAMSPGYEARPIDPSELKPGDFVNILAGAGTAMALEVMRPEEAAGLASPRMNSTK
jgi:hypothetical protein